MLLETSTISALPISKKLELLELVSNAIFEDSNIFESPEWHQEVLNSRNDELELENESNWLSLTDVRARLRE